MVGNLLLVVAASAVLVAGVQTIRLDTLQSAAAVQRVELQACGARLQNLIEDVKSDAEIDSIPDRDLTFVPSHWLFP